MVTHAAYLTLNRVTRWALLSSDCAVCLDTMKENGYQRNKECHCARRSYTIVD